VHVISRHVDLIKEKIEIINEEKLKN